MRCALSALSIFEQRDSARSLTVTILYESSQAEVVVSHLSSSYSSAATAVAFDDEIMMISFALLSIIHLFTSIII